MPVPPPCSGISSTTVVPSSAEAISTTTPDAAMIVLMVFLPSAVLPPPLIFLSALYARMIGLMTRGSSGVSESPGTSSRSSGNSELPGFWLPLVLWPLLLIAPPHSGSAVRRWCRARREERFPQQQPQSQRHWLGSWPALGSCCRSRCLPRFRSSRESGSATES